MVFLIRAPLSNYIWQKDIFVARLFLNYCWSDLWRTIWKDSHLLKLVFTKFTKIKICSLKKKLILWLISQGMSSWSSNQGKESWLQLLGHIELHYLINPPLNKIADIEQDAIFLSFPLHCKIIIFPKKFL